MATTMLRIPKGAVSMREGTIVAWKVASGATVRIGEPLYELESEKSMIEVESPAAGVISILAEAGQTLPVGHLIAEISA